MVCQICRSPQASAQEFPTGTAVNCENCGPYRLTDSADAALSGPAYGVEDRAKFAYAVRRRGGGVVNTGDLEQWRDQVELPSVTEMMDNLVLHVHKMAAHPGEQVNLTAENCRAVIGAPSGVSAAWILREALGQGLIEGRVVTPIGWETTELHMGALTMRGHLRVRELLRAAVESRKAFMAMKFGEQELDAIFLQAFKPAVKKTGFNLVRLDENPSAGLIDDRMRVEIRTSRFLIADLTHGNPGAYWEAGFAEGLGRPVIYTCRKDVFDGPTTRPHFDTNHHLTVIWDPDYLDRATAELKSVIRATLPTESILTD